MPKPSTPKNIKVKTISRTASEEFRKNAIAVPARSHAISERVPKGERAAACIAEVLIGSKVVSKNERRAHPRKNNLRKPSPMATPELQ
jgi:hypothetical protein